MQSNSNSIVIIDYGMGNLRSVFNKFKRLGISCRISSKPEDIQAADKLILPGVGHFKTGMSNLMKLDLIETLNRKVLAENTPIWGICLGVQLFSKFSEEGQIEGLGWVNAQVNRFNVKDKLKYKIPHIGWNSVEFMNRNPLDNNIDENDSFYFVHSYHLRCNEKSDIWMKTIYEYEFVSAIRKNNIFGTQFHPEKSHDSGIKLLKSFAAL